MPTTVDDLLQGKPRPVVTKPEDSLESALGRMLALDYSQLPVVDDAERAVAIVAHESVVRALDSFRITLSGMRVSDAMDRRFEVCRPDDELLEVLDKLQRAPAVLVIGTHQKLEGIVTSFDTTQYFRRRTEDIMLAQDVELMLKDFVQVVFAAADEALSEAALLDAVTSISPSNMDLRGPFKKAITKYLAEHVAPGTKFDATAADALFDELLYRKDAPKSVDRLTFWHYIELFFSEPLWSRLVPAFSIKEEAIRRLLNTVRETRNDLAHLREISQRQHDDLRFCKDWLARHSDSIKKLFASTSSSEQAKEPASQAPPKVDEPVAPIEEEPGEEGRYQALASWLQSRPRSEDRVTITFQQLEGLISDKLPGSARDHRSWWANTPVGHSRSKQWLDVGWRVANVSLADEKATFVRNKAREHAYIAFFGALSEALRRTGDFLTDLPAPQGQSWLTATPIPRTGPRVAYLGFSFARNRRFRIELYIDTLDASKNKQIFNALYGRRQAIEAAMGESMSWERLDQRRASRIAVYYTGSIEDSEADLGALRGKAVSAMSRFQVVIGEHLKTVLGELTRLTAAPAAPCSEGTDPERAAQQGVAADGPASLAPLGSPARG